jgi:hypothetical protein
MSRARAAAAIAERLRAVPDWARSRSVPLERAAAPYGLTDIDLGALRDAGLSLQHPNGVELFYGGDLRFLSLYLEPSSLHAAAARLHADLIDRARRTTQASYEFRVVSRSKGAPIAFSLTLRTQVPDLSPDVEKILTDVELDFYDLPEALIGNVAFAQRTRLSECVTAAALVAARLSVSGYDVRTRDGLLISVPCSARHTWAELRRDDKWVPVDPLVLRLLTRVGGLDRTRWKISSPFAGMVVPQEVVDAAAPSPIRWERTDLTFLTREVYRCRAPISDAAPRSPLHS